MNNITLFSWYTIEMVKIFIRGTFYLYHQINSHYSLLSNKNNSDYSNLRITNKDDVSFI